MIWIRGGSPILEEGVMRDVVSGARGSRRSNAKGGLAAACHAVVAFNREIEAAHERPPANTSRIEQITDVLAGHLDLVTCRRRAYIPNRIGVTHNRQSAAAAVRFARGRRVEVLPQAVCLPGYQVHQTRSGRTKDRIVGVVTHRKMLGINPECGHGVSIVIAHGNPLGRYHGRRRVRRRSGSADLTWEKVHQSKVYGGLL